MPNVDAYRETTKNNVERKTLKAIGQFGVQNHHPYYTAKKLRILAITFAG